MNRNRLRMTASRCLNLGFALLCVVPMIQASLGRSSEGLADRVASVLRSSVLVVRNLYQGCHLRYARDGTIKEGAVPGDWKTDAYVAIDGVEFEREQIKLSCQRVVLEYDATKELFRSRRSAPLNIEIEIDPSISTFEDFIRLLDKVFLSPQEKLMDLVPEQWRLALGVESSSLDADREAPGGSSTLADGERFTAPVPIRIPNPTYSKEARRARASGSVTSWIVVDEHGDVLDVAIIKPLGYGLDKHTISTLRTWKFRAATRADKPVKCRVVVGTTFRLF